ncbi:hypothetical protein FE265_12880 [Salmonella enterica subsp. enterica serovar Infantis]|nr:hypothetical protein FE265_12880 [Salmonella enterica subsp. enterica serovar Infantis]QCV30105.1 hypothetical protein FE168_12870 [Salmonella enterica subsp. enterica serovar Infantis]
MKSKKCVGFLPWLLLYALSLTPFFAQAVRSSGAWQELTEQTAAINGTPPQADSVTIPVYQGSVQLRSDAANPVDYSAKPSQFSTSDAGSALILTNPHDTEGDIFAVPPLVWQAERAPTVTLVWADAATPDTPLDPQPVSYKFLRAESGGPPSGGLVATGYLNRHTAAVVAYPHRRAL